MPQDLDPRLGYTSVRKFINYLLSILLLQF